MDDEMQVLTDLDARKREHKVFITDIAIEKVPYIEYKNIEPKHYIALQELSKTVLQISKDDNDSNEVAIVYSLDSDRLIEQGKEYFGISLGTEHEVDPAASVTAYHILRTTLSCAVVCLHNHPNLSKFSLNDVKFFLKNDNVKLMTAITNLGSVSYLVRTDRFDFFKALDLYNEAVGIHNTSGDLKNLQNAADYFLKNCYDVGIIYEDR